MSEQQFDHTEVERVMSFFKACSNEIEGTCETQVWGIPWKEEDFVEQMVKFGHPATIKSGLPEVLQETVDFYCNTTVAQRAKLGDWLRRLVELKSDEEKLKSYGPRCGYDRQAKEHSSV